MDRRALIDLLNKDAADEHASIIRYLIHAYQAGEDTPLGSMLLSMAREEMWHMNWLSDEIGEMGAEPDMKQGVFPHDPTSNASLLRSYIAWEDNLVKEYEEQAAQVDSQELKTIFMQLSKESIVHSKRFAKMLEKLGAEGEEPLACEDTGAFSPELVERMQSEMTDEYRLVLQHLRHAFIFEEENCPVGSELELTAMRHMKHLSHFAEELAESGHDPDFVHPTIDMSHSITPALQSDLALTEAAREQYAELSQDPELAEHTGLQIEVEQMIYQEEFLASTVEGLMEEAAQPEGDPEAPDEPDEEQDTDAADAFTVGSLIKK